MVRRACIHPGCLAYGEDTTRCPAHQGERVRAKDSRRYASGDGAQKKLRAMLNKELAWRCSLCRVTFPPHALEVDHRVPLRQGGRDVAENLQILCIPCHRAKSTQESGRGGGP